ncbi:MAG: glycine cleavage system protein H [Gemmatimonadota bacterium]|nr:MAG: glycine cleavage system protein H [Gemmatimonadota bacterium]
MVAILVALTFILAVTIDALIRRRQKAKAVVAVTAKPMPSFPLGYFLTPGHVWLNLRPSGKLFMGVDELIQRTLGKVSQIRLRKEGETIQTGEVLAVLSQGDRDIRLLSPVDGTIEKTNVTLEKSLHQSLERPYESGWFYLIRPSNLSESLKNFIISDKAKAWWSQELKRLRDFFQSRIPQEALAGSTLLDGGPPLDEIAQHLDNKAFEEFETLFLHAASVKDGTVE